MTPSIRGQVGRGDLVRHKWFHRPIVAVLAATRPVANITLGTPLEPGSALTPLVGPAVPVSEPGRTPALAVTIPVEGATASVLPTPSTTLTAVTTIKGTTTTAIKRPTPTIITIKGTS